MLQMKSTPVGSGLPSPATLLFNRPIRALLLKINREPINFNDDNEHFEALKTCQDKYTKGSDTQTDWTHSLVEETNDTEHQRWSYMIRVMKMAG